MMHYLLLFLSHLALASSVSVPSSMVCNAGGGSGSGTCTSVGLLDGSSPPIYTISGSPVTTAGTLTFTLKNENANACFIGPSSGASAQPTFRALVGADLPNPSSSTLGGVQSYAAVTNQWINAISTSGVPSSTQPDFSNLSGTASLTTQVTGVLPVANGGTNSSTSLNNNRVVVSLGGSLAEYNLLANNRAMVTNNVGLPATSVTTSTEIGYLTGATSNIQTQLNSKVTLTIPVPIGSGGTNTTVALNNNRFMVSLGGSIAEYNAIASNRALVSDNVGLPSASVVTSTEVNALSGITSNIQTQLNAKQASLTLPLSIANGGTNTGTALNNNKIIVSLGGSLAEYNTLSANRAMTTNNVGLPAVSSVTSSELNFLSGATSNLQTQINTKQDTLTLPLSVANGGTNTGTALNNNKFMVSLGGSIAEYNTIAANRALVSNSVGLPAASAVTSTEVGFLSGVTSALQTQINSKTTLSLPVSIANGGTNSSTALSNNKIIVSLGGSLAEYNALTSNRVMTTDNVGLPAVSSVTSSELNFLSGVTSPVQTQINSKTTLSLPVSIANGGTNATTALNGNRFVVAFGSSIAEYNLVANNRALVTNNVGLPATSITTSTEIGYLSGVTSLLQSQLNLKATTINANALCGGRLTTLSGSPVTTANRTSQGTIYFTPFRGGSIALFTAGAWEVLDVNEISLALTMTSGKNYDVFIYDNAGTATLELSTAWTSDAVRTPATNLALLNGVYVKSTDSTRRYVGTIRASGTNVTEDSSSNRFVWSHCNRITKKLVVTEATSNWAYTTITFRQANGSSANQVNVVRGLDEDMMEAQVLINAASASGGTATVGVGLDAATTVNLADIYGSFVTSAGQVTISRYVGYPGVGYHSLLWLEAATSPGTITWYSAYSAIQVGGLSAWGLF